MDDVVTSISGVLGSVDSGLNGGLQRAFQPSRGQAADLVRLHRAGLSPGLLERDVAVEVVPQAAHWMSSRDPAMVIRPTS
ncbi:hypothetical protein [Geodermatophilus saharensis]|uniref:hypothetical protein n=1 Tax=Geodermatophilus saharensis TaxID=1137994 RepID=UPI000B78FCC3|nr:hypothetical protein [Geodermatophilus saharensis]